MRSILVAMAAALAMLVSAPRASAEKYTLQLATLAPDGSPWASLLKKFKSNVARRSGGRIVVKLKLGGTMGDENATVRQAARGRIQAVGASTGAVASLVTELSAVEIPFMFRSAKEADYVIDKKLTRPLEQLFRKRGLVLGFWSENGYRHFGSKRGKIASPADLRGRKMRSQENFVHIEMWKAFNASAQAIPSTEVVTALKTGSVDGWDQALLYAIGAGWYTSIKHLTLSGHIYQPAVIAYNKDWFDSLPEDLQTIILEEGRKLERIGRRSVRKMNPDLVGIFKDAGIQVHTLSKQERAEFEKAARVVRARFRETQGKSAAAILDLVEEGVREFRARAGQ